VVDEFTRGRESLDRWWGRSFDGDITVVIDDRQRVSMALVPAWNGQRGLMLFPTRGVLSGSSPILHELVHVYAPNQNRFLAEGLAVYAHHLLKGAPGFPNFGEDLHRLARDVAARVSIEKLDTIPTPTPPAASGLDERVYYVAAGSFVGYLVETWGIDKFRELYAATPL